MQRGVANIFLVGVIIAGILAIAGFLLWQNKNIIPGGQKACTLEAMICPDGTGVGRTGPNCEFAPCPPSK